MKKVLFILLSLLIMAMAVSCDSSATVSANAVLDFSDVELKAGDRVVIDVTCGSKTMPSLEFTITDPSQKTPKFPFKAIKRTSGTIDVKVYRQYEPVTKSDTEEYLVAEGSAEITEFSEGDSCTVSMRQVEPPTFYTVSFNSNGGSEVSSQQVPSGGYAWEPSPAPTRDNYTFDGWFSDPELKNRYWFYYDGVYSDMTLHAKWIPIYTVTLNPGDGSPVYTQSILEGECVSEPCPIPEELGFVFVGWFSDLEYKHEYDFSTPVTEDLYLIGKLVPYDSKKNYVGGRIFYIAEDNGAEYRFYNERGEELTEQTVEGLEKAFTYTKSGSSDADKFYVLHPNGTFGVEWGAAGTFVGATNEGIGAGKKNYEIGLKNSACWYPYEEGHLTVCSWALYLLNSVGTAGCYDWYVPSFAEMTKLRDSYLADRWGIREYNYFWTSEEVDMYDASTWVNIPDFDDIYKGQHNKTLVYPAFAIRSF